MKSFFLLLVFCSSLIISFAQNTNQNHEWVIIESTPDNANVFINEVFLGTTPYSGKFEYGSYNYKLSLSNHHSEEGKFSLSSTSGKQKVSHILKPDYGSIEITSSPEGGASIYLDGKYTDKKTPSTLTNINSGKHKIELRHNSYKTMFKEVDVAAAQTTKVVFELLPIFGEIDIITKPPEADIFLDGNKIGTSPMTISPLIAGNHVFVIKKIGYETVNKNILIEDSKLSEYSVVLKEGVLTTISSNPTNVLIFIDGNEIGYTPLKTHLSPSSHIFKLKKNEKSFCGNIDTKGKSNIVFTERQYAGWSDQDSHYLYDNCEYLVQTNLNLDRINNEMSGGFGNGTGNSGSGTGDGNPGDGTGPGGNVGNRRAVSSPLPPQREGMFGEVKLSYTVAPDGTVGDIKIVSSNCTECNALATATLKKWKYEAKSVGIQTGMVTFNFVQQ